MEGDHFHHIFYFITLVWIFRLIFSFERKELKASRTGRDAPAFDSVYSPAYWYRVLPLLLLLLLPVKTEVDRRPAARSLNQFTPGPVCIYIYIEPSKQHGHNGWTASKQQDFAIDIENLFQFHSQLITYKPFQLTRQNQSKHSPIIWYVIWGMNRCSRLLIDTIEIPNAWRYNGMKKHQLKFLPMPSLLFHRGRG